MSDTDVVNYPYYETKLKCMTYPLVLYKKLILYDVTKHNLQELPFGTKSNSVHIKEFIPCSMTFCCLKRGFAKHKSKVLNKIHIYV